MPKGTIQSNTKLKVSAAQNNLLCNFFEENPEVIKGYTKTPKCMKEVQNKWKKVTTDLNSVGPSRDYKSWAKYLCDMKAKLKRKIVKWKQSGDGTGLIMCNSDDFDEIRLRMFQVLRNIPVSREDHNSSDKEAEDNDTHNEGGNDEMDAFSEEKLEVKSEINKPEYIQLIPNDTPPPDLRPQFLMDDEFDYFGRNVALQLRTLPLPVALETQEMLLSVLKKQRLKVLNGISSSTCPDPLSKYEHSVNID